MHHTYVVGTFVDSMTGMQADYFSDDFDVIVASSKEAACGIYNQRHNCSYFYSRVMAEIDDDGNIIELDDYARPVDVKTAVRKAIKKQNDHTLDIEHICDCSACPEPGVTVKRTIGYLTGHSWMKETCYGKEI